MEVTTLDLERLLRFAGLRVTRSRTTVLAAVHEHPHAGTDMVVDAARRVLPDLSRQAVHDSLRALVEVGLVRRFQLGSVVRFEAQAGDNHHHVECTSCGQIANVDCAGGQPPCLSPADSRGFLISAAEVVYQGLCPDCAGRSDEHRRHVQRSLAQPFRGFPADRAGPVTPTSDLGTHRLPASLPPTEPVGPRPPASTPTQTAEATTPAPPPEADRRPGDAVDGQAAGAAAPAPLPVRRPGGSVTPTAGPPVWTPVPEGSPTSRPHGQAALRTPFDPPVPQVQRDPRTRRSAYLPAASLASPRTAPEYRAPRSGPVPAARHSEPERPTVAQTPDVGGEQHGVATRPGLRGAQHSADSQPGGGPLDVAPTPIRAGAPVTSPLTPAWASPQPRHTAPPADVVPTTSPRSRRAEDDRARPPEPVEGAAEHSADSRRNRAASRRVQPAQTTESADDPSERPAGARHAPCSSEHRPAESADDRSEEHTPPTRRRARHEAPRPQPV